MVRLIDLSNSFSTTDLLRSDGHVQKPELRWKIVGKIHSSLRLQRGGYAQGKPAINFKDLAWWFAERVSGRGEFCRDAVTMVTATPHQCKGRLKKE